MENIVTYDLVDLFEAEHKPIPKVRHRFRDERDREIMREFEELYVTTCDTCGQEAHGRYCSIECATKTSVFVSR